jgi:hypothetical protein
LVRSIKSDWGLRPRKILRGSWAYGIDNPTHKFELTSGLVGSRPAINRDDRLFFLEMCGNSPPPQIASELHTPSEIPRGHVVLHHGAFFQLVLDGVRMVGACHFEKFLEVIERLSCLVLEVTLGSSNELLVRIISLLVVVTLFVAASDYYSLGSLLWPPLIAFGAPPCILANRLEWCPLTTTGGCLPVTLDENSPDCLLARGMPSGDVEQLLHGLWLIVTELMHQGLVARARLDCRDDVGVIDLVEFMALSGESLNVILERFTLLLLTTL